MPSSSNSQCHQTALLAFAGALAFCATAAKAQQPATFSRLPATPPTSASAASALPAPIAATPVSPREGVPRHRARVTYTAGLLEVEANNSSLNGILRDISAITGMKLTGGVADQRVFGNYGPAVPSTILATLLDGTGSNMLLRETASNAPAELILTPRTGSVTPPAANAPGFDSDPDDSPQATAPPPSLPTPQQTPFGYNTSQVNANGQAQPPASGPRSIPQPWNNVLGSPSNTTPTASSIPTVNSVSTDSLATPSTAQPVSGIVDSTNPPPPGSTGFGSTTPTDPGVNAAKTPEQIFQQLQNMRQAAQQQQPQSGTVPSTTNITPTPH